jgi:putative addiction module killer protein
METRETEAFTVWMRNIKDKVTRAIITARLRRVSLGNFGDTRPVGGGVSELRIAYGPGLRIYFKRVNDIAVLLCGGGKASQRRDIETAKLLAENLENMEDIWRR